MQVTIHQPDFLPWIGFFERWDEADLYMVLDDVQFLRRGWHHRDCIKTAQGPQWLTVPVKSKGRYDQAIREVEIDGDNWRRKHLKAVELAYRKAPYFDAVFSGLRAVYERRQRLLIDLNMDLLQWAAGLLGITTPVVYASEYGVTVTRTERLVALTRAVGAEVYLSGTGSRSYLEEHRFEKAGLRVRWHTPREPSYPQLHGRFIPRLSVLDFLMNGDVSRWRA